LDYVGELRLAPL